MNAIKTSPVVTVVGGNVTTLSTDVATFFEKPHDAVLKAIAKIIQSVPSNRLVNFDETVVTRANPSGGAPIKSKAYRLTRDGFTFLAMGFTGARAQEFKWAYIDAFNKMEAALRQCPAKAQLPAPTLTEQQAYAIMSKVAMRAKRDGVKYQTIYRALKARYQVTKYTHILQRDFEDAIEFIRTMTLNVPEEIPQAKAAPVPESRPKIVVSPTFCENMRNFIFIWNYLHRDHLIRFLKLLKDLRSPYAEGLSDAIHSLNMDIIELSLADIGFPVKELDCYKYWAIKHAAK